MSMSSAIKGAHASALPRKSRSYREGRVCLHPDCKTRLSIYNRRDTCFNHAGFRVPRLRGKRKGA